MKNYAYVQTMIDPTRLRNQIENVPSFSADKPSSSVSSRYGFVRTPDIVEILQEQGYELRNVRGGMKGSSRDFGMHEARMIKLDGEKFGRGDVFPEIVITNSHDRSSRALLDLGFWRKACDNGLVANIAQAANFQLTHLGDLKSQIVKAVGSLAEYAQIASGRIEEFQNRHLSATETQEFLRRAAALRGAVKAQGVGYVSREADDGDNLWLVFNRAQENLLKGRFHKAGKRGLRSQRPITSVRRGLNLNKDLWSLAEQFLPN
jgi:hypothetical protein